MRIKHASIPHASRALIDKLIRQRSIEAETQKSVSIAQNLEKVLVQYHKSFEKFQDQADELMKDQDTDEANEAMVRKQIVMKLAIEEGVGVYSEALDYLNEVIEEFLWEDKNVEEIYASSNELNATITPIMKKLAINERDYE